MKTLKLLCAALAVVCCSLVAEATEPITYLDWDPVQRQMTNATATSYVVVTNGIEVFEAGSTYVVNDWVTAPYGISVNGTEAAPTTLILCKGGWLTANGGVEVTVGHKLVICEQVGCDEETTHQLDASDGNMSAGIGGGWNGACGTIVINGGIVNATGGYQSAGIGGCFMGSNRACGDVTINGGTVNARGHTNAAGIGGANGGAGGTVTINGGMVSGYGGASAAGIGGGYHGAGGTVAINGGMVTAEGDAENGVAGIGAGAYESPMDPGTVTFGPGMDYWILAGTDWSDQVEVSTAEFIADHSAPSVFISSSPLPPGPTAKAVVENDGKTLKFVYDSVDYDSQGKTWYSLADYEETALYVHPEWHAHCGTVTNAVFDPSFAVCKPKKCVFWFYEFTQLVGVEGLENLDTSETTSFVSMFDSCSSLTSLDLSRLDTAKVADMCWMFWKCQSLTQLNLSGFDTAKVTDMCGMFEGCSSLVTIYVSNKFVTTAVEDSFDMFNDCSSLVGGKGTAYDSTKTDKTYACIDGEDGLPGYFTRGAAKGVAGEYGKWTLPDLGIEPPAAGTVYAVTAYGLPSGLKLKYNAAKKDKKGKVIVKAKTDWWIEGVPTAALDAKTNPMYLAVTVGKETTWYPVAFSVRAQAVTDMGTFTVGTPLNEVCWLPGVTNGWTVSGLPKGLSYTAKTVYADKKKTKVKYAPYTTYGKFSAAGLYTVTAKKKVGSYYETLKFKVLVNPSGDFTTRDDLTTYIALSPTVTNKNLKAVSGLPAGITFNAKKYIVSGKPTKAGTFAVTFTPKTGAKWTEMWIVAENEDGPELGFNTTGETSMEVTQGQMGAENERAFVADGTVTASGLPKGMKLVKRTDPETGDVSYALAGTPTTTGTSFVTVKATKNGQTLTQRVAVTVKANPLKGTYYGYSVSKDGKYQYRTASLTIAASGKATLKYTEGSKTYTLTTAAGEISGAEAGYRFVQKADTKKKIPARTVMVGISFTDMIAIGDWAACAGTVWDYPSRINDGGFFKALSAATVNALRTDPETGFAPKATYVLANEADQAEVIYATYAYSSSTGKFTVKGKLPRGKAFSATVSAVTSGNLMLAPISAVDADGTRYLLLLTPGHDGEVRVDGFDTHAYAVDSLRFDFGTGYTALPTTFKAAIANTVTNFMPVSVTYAKKGDPATSEEEWICVRANGTKYFQVSFDEGKTWSAKAEYKYDKERGLITLSFTNGKTKYALDLLYAQPELLYGQMKRQSNPVYNKKTKKTTYTTEYGAAIACFVL